MTSGRRNFLLGALGGAAGITAMSAGDLNAMMLAGDEEWLAAYAGKKHKAMIDVMHFFPDGTPFRRAKNLLNVLHENYGAKENDIAITVGMHGRGVAHALSQALWDDLGLMEWLAPQMNGAEQAALKSGAGTFAQTAADSVRELRARGVHFVACRETIGRWAARVAAAKGQTADEVAARITKGLHEGVETVPAMIAAAVLAQESGARYVAVA